ncbi:MAG: glycosyltransferase family 4 protein [Solirubrobacteraceae bacterium]
MSGPHVLVVLHEPGVGGATNAVLRVLPELEQHGWSFSFWAPCPSPVAELLVARGWPVAGEERPLRYSWGALREPPGAARRLAATPGYLGRLRAHIRRLRPDLVHANTVVALPEAAIARSTGTPTLLHVHEMLSAGLRGASAVRLARVADHTAAVSQASAQPLRRTGLGTSVITAGLRLPPPPRARTAGQRLVVGTLATVSHRKGSDTFLAAAIALKAEWPDVEFRMIGPLAPGRERIWAGELTRRAEVAGIQCGATADALRELAGWDVFVLPSRRDPFPLAVLEAMGTGLPVVATVVDGLPEQVDVSCGVLVAPGDAVALRRAVAALLADAPRRAALGAAGRARVAREFTSARHAREQAEAYLATLASARGAHRDPKRARYAP